MEFKSMLRISTLLTWIMLWGTTTFASHSVAEVLWQDFSVSYLNGSHYKVNHKHQQIITFEHVAGTSWGDSFMFIDHLRGGDNSRSNYVEWSPRISLCKATNHCITNGLIKDVLIATTVEMSSTATHFLYGVGLDLNVPQFQFIKLNFYRRQNDGIDNNWQMTTSWARGSNKSDTRKCGCQRLLKPDSRRTVSHG